MNSVVPKTRNGGTIILSKVAICGSKKNQDLLKNKNEKDC